LDELFARVRALIRRSQTSSEVLTFSDLWINVRTRKARRGQRWLYLSNTEFAILEMFMRQPGEILSKERFLHEIWNESDPRDNNVVEVFMRYLRIKLETMGDTRLIHTVRGRGYLLEIRPEQS
jgi:two-component system response regulator MprA